MADRQFQIQTPGGLWPPSWPMGMTMLRLLLLPVFLWTILLDAGPGAGARPHRWWAVAIFVVMAITDKLDGYLARRLKQTSHVGAVLDPIADKLLIASATILLSFKWVASPYYHIPIAVVIAVYGKDLIVAAGSLVLLGLVGRVLVRPRILGRVCTVVQLALIIATLIGPDLASAGPYVRRGLWVAVVAISAASCADYVLQGWFQFRAARSATTTAAVRQGV